MKILIAILIAVLLVREWQHRRHAKRIHAEHNHRQTDMAQEHLKQVQRLQAHSRFRKG